MALAAYGGGMTTPGFDKKFYKLQRWYTPKRVRQKLEDYRELLYPYVAEREDERGMPPHRRAPWDVTIERRANVKADIDRALIWLQYVNRDVDAAEAIYLYYLTLDNDGQLMTQERVAELQRCTERTVRNRIRRGVDSMAFFLGSYESGREWERE